MDDLRVLSQTYGDIPGVPIFTEWDKRAECSKSAVHRPITAGISGNSQTGAYSVALSDLYMDDEDEGDVIIYTGSGGKQRWDKTKDPKRPHFSPQVVDQSWHKYPNNTLRASLNTGNPVRVIRSWKCDSKYAPLEGYRYDGLYKVTACWRAKGLSGLKICRCRLERLPDQPPIPVNLESEEDDSDEFGRGDGGSDAASAALE